MNIFKVFIISFFIALPVIAQNTVSTESSKIDKNCSEKKWTFKFGWNYSAFRGSDNQLISGVTFGFNRYWNISENLNLSSEILLTSQGGFLNDKPVKGPEIDWYLYSWDVRCKVYYLEIPIFLSYNYYSEPFGINFYFGPSYRFGITDHSERTKENLIYDDSNPELKEKYTDYNFEFYQTDREFHAFPQSGFGLNIGLAINYRYLLLDLRYSYALHKIGGVEQLKDVNRKSHVIHFMLGYKF